MEKPPIPGCSQRRQFVPGVQDGTFVGGDGVGSGVKRRANVVNRRLSRGSVERTHLKQRISFPQAQPLVHICRLLRLGEISAEQLLGSKSAGRYQPSQPARGQSGHAPANAIALAELRLFVAQQRDEGLADVAKSNDTEVIGADAGISRVKWLCSLL
jgi:hypothetical protein